MDHVHSAGKVYTERPFAKIKWVWAYHACLLIYVIDEVSTADLPIDDRDVDVHTVTSR